MSWLISAALLMAYENSRCSQAQGEEYLAGTCSDGEPFAQLNVKPTQHPFWRNDKTTDTYRHSLFGLTCAVLTDDRGADVLTWCLADSRARIFQLPEAAQDSTAHVADSGESLRGLLAKYDPLTHSLKTAQGSLFSGLIESSPTLPRSGTMRNGECYQRETLAHRMSGRGCGFLQNECIPTPTVCGNYNRKGASKTSGDGLATYVKMHPTPCASNNRNRGGPNSPAIARRIEIGKQVSLSMTVDGPMNPTFPEWLMGWPIGWTESSPLATDRFQSAWLSHFLSYTGD